MLHALSDEEAWALLDALSPAEILSRGADILRAKSPVTQVVVVLQGEVCSYKALPEGSRQILGFHLPGDFANLPSAMLASNDCGVVAATACVVARIRTHKLGDLMKRFENLGAAILRYTLVQCSMLQSSLTRVGRQTALQRLAHLFCELFVRLRVVDLASENRPVLLHIVQADLADATGLSPVHVNRTLQSLRARGLIGRNPHKLEILDWEGLRQLADFDPAYLQLDVLQNVDWKPADAGEAYSRSRVRDRRGLSVPALP
jgi:CRP-like cAMP-binding protein